MTTFGTAFFSQSFYVTNPGKHNTVLWYSFRQNFRLCLIKFTPHQLCVYCTCARCKVRILSINLLNNFCTLSTINKCRPCTKTRTPPFYCRCDCLSPPMRPKSRGLAQHGGSPGWLEESVILYTWWTGRTACLSCTVPVALTGAAQLWSNGISSCCYIIMYTTILHELHHTRKAWHGTLID